MNASPSRLVVPPAPRRSSWGLAIVTAHGGAVSALNWTEGGAATVSLGDVSVDLVRRVVTRGDEVVRLTPIEYKLLAHLVANARRVLTHRDLLTRVWGPNSVEHSHYLRIYMTGLRRKLEANPGFPVHILTESGVGYRLVL